MAGQQLLNKPEVHYGSIRNRIEGMAALGLSTHRIARDLNTSLGYVERVVVAWRHTMRKPEPVFDDGHKERDEIYWKTCLWEGGFPAAVIRDGRTFHVYPSVEAA